MQTAPFKALGATVAALALVACSASKRPAEEPSSTTTTTGVGVSTRSGPDSVGDVTGLAPLSGVRASSAAPATPMEGSCPPGNAPLDARDVADCTRRCRGMDEAVPLGSRCVSARTACEAECSAKY